MNENLKFEFCEQPTGLTRAGRSPLTEFIQSAPVNQWIKVEGYADKKELNSARNSISGAKSTTFKAFRDEGINLQTRTDSKNLILYICKVKE